MVLRPPCEVEADVLFGDVTGAPGYVRGACRRSATWPRNGCYRAEMRNWVILGVIVLMVTIAGFLFWQSSRGYHGACVQIRPIPGAPWTRVPNDGHEYSSPECSDDSRVG